MTFLHNISTVAHYEARTLSRSWFFRLFMIGSLFIFTFMNIGLFSPIGDEQWNMVSIPASVPLVNLYLLNIGQAIVVIFLAADFLKRDKKVDTNEVLYTRSMSNFEYIIGKTWGILRLFLTLDLVILGIAMIVNLISKQMKIDFIAYLQYLLIISVPTIIFSLGLAFMLMSIIRNQALTFLVLLGYAALDMFWLYYRAGSVFDYMAFGLPLYKSGILGFDNFGLILNQRLMYLFAGLALVMSTILIFKRLPQSKPHMVLSSVLLVAFTAGAAFCTFNTLQFYNSAKVTKNDVIRINRQYESVSFPSLTDARLEVEHTADGIAVKAFLKIFNDTEKPLDEYCFSLNPGLKVNRITRNGKETGFRNDGHIIIATPGIQLPAGETDSLEVDYSGTITEAFCYPNFDDNIKDYPYRIAMVNVRKRQAFLTGDYALLTPETHWYPTFGLNYYPSNPARIKVDFTRFTLNVKTREDLVAVSQGLPGKNNDIQVYKPGTPLTGLTLAIGNYIADTMKVGKIEYLAWHYPGNDYYKKDLSELKDTIKLLVSGIMTELETNFSTKYPFSTLSLVEAPIQYYSYPRQNTQTRSEVQPSMVIIPEKLSTMENAGFAKRFTRQKKNMQRNNQVITPKELQVRIFNNFVRNAFISGENFRFRNGVAMNEPTRYRLGPSFYFFINNFFSESYPVINAAFESHLQKVNTPGRQGGQMMFFGESLSENDKANLIMRDKSFRDIMAMNPGDDTVRTILTVKGDVFFNLLRKHAGIDQFSTWFHSYLDTNKFRRVNITTFDKDFNKKFGYSFYPQMEDWFTGVAQPGFIISNLEAREIIVGDRSRYQVTFIASNSEKTGGIFNIAFQTGGGGRGMMMDRVMSITVTGVGGGGSRGAFTVGMAGRGMDATDISKIVYLGPGEAKRIGVVLDNQPRSMQVNMLFCKNLPGEQSIPINEVIKTREKTTGFDGEELLPSIPLLIEPNELIVDNEDKGFINDTAKATNRLRKILGIKAEKGEVYGVVNQFWAPDYWQPVIQTNYYGWYIKSAVYTRAGTGDKSIEWKGIIKSPGYYDVYAFVGKAGSQMSVRGAMRAGGGPGPGGGPGGPMGGPQQMDSPFKELHFLVYHDQGSEPITLDFENAEPGWNKLGTYYMSPDTVKVKLTNQTNGRMVIGDAIKWVLQR